MNKLLSLLIILLIVQKSLSQRIDSTFVSLPSQETAPYSSFFMDNGKFIHVGDFMLVNGRQLGGVARFNADGSIDNTFAIGKGTNWHMSSALVQPDGKIILGGRYFTLNSQQANYLFRLNTDGTFDPTFSFSGNYNSDPDVIKLLPDGKLLVGKVENGLDGLRRYIFRLNSDGSWDNSFDAPDVDFTVRSMDILPDGRILVGGSNTSGGGGIKMLHPDGSADTSFAGGIVFDNVVFAVKAVSPNRILVGGYFFHFNQTEARYGFIALKGDGTQDFTFPVNNDGYVFDIAQQSDGKIVVVGGFTYINSVEKNRIARLNTDGTVDATFNVGTGADGTLSHVYINGNDEILVTSYAFNTFDNFNSQFRNGTAVLTKDGVVKETLPIDLQTPSAPAALAKQGDKLLFGYFGNEINGVSAKFLARLNRDGNVDPTFNGNGAPDNGVSNFTFDAQGRILLTGNFNSYNGVSSGQLVRIDQNGNLDQAFSANIGFGFEGVTHRAVEQADGKIIVGGSFNYFKGYSIKSILRLNSDGTLDNSFNVSNGFSTNSDPFLFINVLKVLPDGKILVGGRFQSFDGHAVKNLMRLNSDGSFDNTFPSSFDTNRFTGVSAIELLPDGKILIGGDYLSRHNADGSLESYIGSNISNVGSIFKQDDGKFLVTFRYGVVRLNESGDFEEEFGRVDLDFYTLGKIVGFGNEIFIAGEADPVFAEYQYQFGKIIVPPAPVAPSELQANRISAKAFHVSWTDNSDDENGFKVERSANGIDYEVLPTIARDQTEFTDTTATLDYIYRIRAFNGGGYSPYDVITAVKEDPAISLQTFPNPSNGFTTVWYRSENNGSGEISLLNAKGQTLQTDEVYKTSERFEYQYDLSSLPKGLYIVRLSLNNQSLTQKVIRE